MSRPSQVWCLFVLFLGLAAGALGWLTRQTLSLDRAEAVARRQAEQEEKVGLALWRMDAFLMPLLVQEAARPEFVYQANYFVENAQGAKQPPQRTLSPLLQQPPEFVRLHFQLAADGRLTSPQAPLGDDLTWSLKNGVAETQTCAAQTQVAELKRLLTYADLVARLPAQPPPVALVDSPQTLNPQVVTNTANSPVVESFAQQSLNKIQQDEAQTGQNPIGRGFNGNNELAQADPPPQQAVANDANYNNFGNTRRGQSQARNPNADLSSRNNVYQAYAQKVVADNRGNQKVVLAPPAIEGVSSPFWVGTELFLARRVERGGEVFVQGCWLDWPQLSVRLRDEIADVLPDVELRPASAEDAPALSRALATLPVQVIAQAVIDPVIVWSPVRVALALAWVGLLATAAAAAVTLQGIIALSERRAAFVAAVTHELRTPLTTFRMYAEMLAGGMVPLDRQPTYLETLRAEADRLAHLVDNVLQYARLERGSSHKPRETVLVPALLERIASRLAARTEQAELKLEVEISDSAEEQSLTTDVAAVEQILFNLIDNACKYAAHGSDKRLHLHVESVGNGTKWRVRDHGPGIPPTGQRRLFSPFSKSVHEAAITAPGVGLGLALSRRLAHELGGELRLETTSDAGTTFVLTLPG